MFHVNFSAKSFVTIVFLIGICFCSSQVIAQKKVAQKSVKVQKAGNRVDALIQRNRKLTNDINALNQLLARQGNQALSQEGVTNYYKSMLKSSRDSTANITNTYAEYKARTEIELTSLKAAFADSMELFREFRKQSLKERNRIVKDTNVVRVYTMPYDQVRVRVLRKILDEGIGLVIERNTDEGFLVSKVFKDRKSRGLFKRTIETRVDCDIKMVQHPYEDNKTLFYASTRVQEKSRRDSQFIELTDNKVIKDYQKKLLKFFDDFLVVN